MSIMLVLEYKIQFKYNADRDYPKVKNLVKWCDNNNIGIQTKKLDEKKKSYLIFYFQVTRESEKLLVKWKENIIEKVRKTFKRVPHKTVELIQNQGFEQLEQMVAEYEGAKS